MNSIDFSKAPEGATHYCASNGEFYRGTSSRIEVWSHVRSRWFPPQTFNSLSALTPIPAFEPFTSCEDAQPTGSKHDSGKPLMGAVPPNALLAVAKVLTFGIEKYGRDNWHQVENLETRYMDAALRHINAYQRGEQLDPESGENHLAHAVCSLMFILEKEL
jgi:hypothetical protein